MLNALNNRGEDSFLITELDECGGRCSKARNFHYHGTRTYPCQNGGMRGVVTVADG